MKQFKVILIVLGILLTGFGGGFFTHRALVGKQLEKVRALGRGPGFGQHLLERIDATPEQRDQLLPVLKDYGKRMGEITRESRQERRVLIDSMFAQIRPVLNEDQITSLQEVMARFHEKNEYRRPEKKKKKPGDGKKSPSELSKE